MKKQFLLVAFVLFHAGLEAQTFTPVPLDNGVYYILEQAVLRGLCSPLPPARPWTRSVVLAALREALAAEGRLSQAERIALENAVLEFSPPKLGWNIASGRWYGETRISSRDVPLSAQFGIEIQTEASGAFYPKSNEFFWGTEIWAKLFLAGDITSYASYEIIAEGGLMRAPRKTLGDYYIYYKNFIPDQSERGTQENETLKITSFSEPLTHFPYSYKKRWDGSIYFLSDLYSFSSWPDSIAGAYGLSGSLGASFWDNKLFFRIGRLSHEWGDVPAGASLALNAGARPFAAVEAEFTPFSWFGFYSMTGILEYFNTKGIKDSAQTFQNAYSISMFKFNYKSAITLNLGEAIIWPKRFELGYVIPFISSIFYQNNIGDFDNVSMFINLKAQKNGWGQIWASLFWDEAYWVRNAFELDRTMIAVQAGAEIPLPFLLFSSLHLSYTKINPYTYTHTQIKTPWYETLYMQEAYVNNGVSLGYYLPPNTDEILVRFKTMPIPSLETALQYQLVRHGADYGDSAVDGSSLYSELDPNRDGSHPETKRYFLHDGAYQWMHIVKLRADWHLKKQSKIPLTFYCETGAVISYFTNTIEPANSGASHDYSIIDTPEYPRTTSFIAKIGIKIF